MRIEREGRVLVVDPGVWSEPRALAGADAVLLTHEHADHADVLRLRGLGVPVFAPADAYLPELDVNAVQAGQTFTAAGFAVRAVGGVHAAVLPDQPASPNLGYVIDDAVYHPGDALTLPDSAIDTLLIHCTRRG